MFDTIPTNFFNLLTSKNRDLFIKALFVLRRAVRQDLYITREDLANRIANSLDKDLSNDFVQEDSDNESKYEGEDLASSYSKALFIIRRLRDYGWINIDFNCRNSFEEYIAVPAYSTEAINFLYNLTDEAEQEYNSLVYSTYSALKIADTDQNDFYDALVSAFQNTDRLNERLASLFYGIRSIEQRIAEGVEINNVLSIHFNEYLLKLHDQYYHPYKTFDSVERFRMPILKLLKKWMNDSHVRKKLIEAAKKKNPDKKVDLLFENINSMYDAIITTYESIDEKMHIIDEKINDYTSATIDKMKHLVQMDESYKGKVSNILKQISEHKDKAISICDMFNNLTRLSCQEYVTKESLYVKRENEPAPVWSEIPPIEEVDRTGEDVDELFLAIQDGFTTQKIKEFILNKVQDGNELSILDINISNDEDFILTILAMLRGDEKDLPFNVVFDEGYTKIKGYTVPNIKFVMKKGGK